MATRKINRSQHRRAYQAADPSMRANARYWRAQAWSRTTGRPLPPSMREREDSVSNAVPLGARDRWNRYTRCNGSEILTPRQGRRMKHKANHAAARTAR